jgi:hypothetical protein
MSAGKVGAAQRRARELGRGVRTLASYRYIAESLGREIIAETLQLSHVDGGVDGFLRAIRRLRAKGGGSEGGTVDKGRAWRKRAQRLLVELPDSEGRVEMLREHIEAAQALLAELTGGESGDSDSSDMVPSRTPPTGRPRGGDDAGLQDMVPSRTPPTGRPRGGDHKGVAGAVTEYLEYIAKGPATDKEVREATRLLRRFAVAVGARRPLSSIGSEEIREFVASLPRALARRGGALPAALAGAIGWWWEMGWWGCP